MTIKLGIDVGGTFTDFVVAEDGTPPRIHKTLSTPHDPSEAVVAGLAQIAAAMDPPRSVRDFVAGVDTIVHGTTVTTNATLTSTGARTALLTTEGVRDALEMRRGIREAQYDNRYTNVVPLVPRARRLGIAGRIDRDGREIAPLDLAAVRAAVQRWRDDGVQAVAVCFMNAFANPAHEQAAAAIVRAEWPEAYLSVSTEVLPAIRFYDRVSTTALNAYVGPKLGHYLDRLVERLAGVGFGGLLLIMQSNGGVITPAAARAKAALTLLSGPSGGPGAGLHYVAALGRDRVITTDMGGTSFEASVAVGMPLVKNDGEIARHRIALPMLDIHTIGAGGGSIGWLDDGGLLRMGPQSAGADPGPACYGRGGTLPTTTDANLVLGYLDPGYFAGGTMPLDVAAARRAIETHIARPMGLSIEQAAAGNERLRNFLRENPPAGGNESGSGQEAAAGEEVRAAGSRFRDALADDFNTPRAMREAFDLVRAVNQRPEDPALAGAGTELAGMLELVGLGSLAAGGDDGPDAAALKLLEARNTARADKDWARADEIRDQLAGLGWEVRDGADGARLVPRS